MSMDVEAPFSNECRRGLGVGGTRLKARLVACRLLRLSADGSAVAVVDTSTGSTGSWRLYGNCVGSHNVQPQAANLLLFFAQAWHV